MFAPSRLMLLQESEVGSDAITEIDALDVDVECCDQPGWICGGRIER